MLAQRLIAEHRQRLGETEWADAADRMAGDLLDLIQADQPRLRAEAVAELAVINPRHTAEDEHDRSTIKVERHRFGDLRGRHREPGRGLLDGGEARRANDQRHVGCMLGEKGPDALKAHWSRNTGPAGMHPSRGQARPSRISLPNSWVSLISACRSGSCGARPHSA